MEQYLPIVGITTFVSRWQIKARVLDKAQKTVLRTNNALFHVDLIDENGDVIRAKFWGEAANKWFPVLEKGKVYKFESGRVTVANKRYNNLPHNYELSFSENSIIELLSDDSSIATTRTVFQFMKLRDIHSGIRTYPFVTDLCVVIHSVNPVTKTTIKNSGTDVSRRSMIFVDDSGFELDVTLWGKNAEKCEFQKHINEIVVLTDVQIKEWSGGVNGQTLNASEVLFNIDNEETRNLKLWVSSGKKNAASFENMRTITGSPSQPINNIFIETDIISLLTEAANGTIHDQKVYIIYGCRVREFLYPRSRDGALKVYYPSCPSCRRKLGHETTFSCTNCQLSSVIPVYRYNLQVAVTDYTHVLNIRVFHEAALPLLGLPAEEIHKLETSGESKAVDAIFQLDGLYNLFKLMVRAKHETVNGQSRVVYTAVKIEVKSASDTAIELFAKIKQKYPSAFDLSSGIEKKMKRELEAVDSQTSKRTFFRGSVEDRPDVKEEIKIELTSH